jgi:hypothetical protein
MTTTPLMGLVLPTDHDSADIWDSILDTVFGRIDSHNHTTGQGAKIPAAALAIDGDVSWSSGGTSHSITDLVALDFKPSPAAGLVALAGALFVSDGTSGLSSNELYWRTTTGTNVKLTAGAALNVAAFTGGIGGDYAAVGALVVFDDATDAYWLQQQVGAGVRQWAKLRTGDVQLFEYKANPTAGPVPANAVTLKSPAALVAGYALTMPTALPASNQPLYVSSAGAVTALQPVQTLQIPAGFALNAATWNGSAADGQTYPVQLNNGDRIVAVRARIQDNATGPTKLTVSLKSVVDGVVTNIATSAQSSGAGTNQTIPIGSLTSLLSSGTNYELVLNKATGAGACIVYWLEVDYDHP